MPRGICSISEGSWDRGFWKLQFLHVEDCHQCHQHELFPHCTCASCQSDQFPKILPGLTSPNWDSKFTPDSIPEITKHSISLLRMWPRRIVYHLFNAITPLKNWKCAALLDPRRLMGHLYTVPWLICILGSVDFVVLETGWECRREARK